MLPPRAFSKHRAVSRKMRKVVSRFTVSKKLQSLSDMSAIRDQRKPPTRWTTADGTSISANRRATSSEEERSTRRTARTSDGARAVSSPRRFSSWSIASTRSPASRKRATTLCPRAPVAPVMRARGLMFRAEQRVHPASGIQVRQRREMEPIRDGRATQDGAVPPPGSRQSRLGCGAFPLPTSPPDPLSHRPTFPRERGRRHPKAMKKEGWGFPLSRLAGGQWERGPGGAQDPFPQGETLRSREENPGGGQKGRRGSSGEGRGSIKASVLQSPWQLRLPPRPTLSPHALNPRRERGNRCPLFV